MFIQLLKEDLYSDEVRKLSDGAFRTFILLIANYKGFNGQALFLSAEDAAKHGIPKSNFYKYLGELKAATVITIRDIKASKNHSYRVWEATKLLKTNPTSPANGTRNSEGEGLRVPLMGVVPVTSPTDGTGRSITSPTDGTLLEEDKEIDKRKIEEEVRTPISPSNVIKIDQPTHPTALPKKPTLTRKEQLALELDRRCPAWRRYPAFIDGNDRNLLEEYRSLR